MIANQGWEIATLKAGINLTYLTAGEVYYEEIKHRVGWKATDVKWQFSYLLVDYIFLQLLQV